MLIPIVISLGSQKGVIRLKSKPPNEPRDNSIGISSDVFFPMYIPMGIWNLYAYSNSDSTWVTDGSDKTQELAAK